VGPSFPARSMLCAIDDVSRCLIGQSPDSMLNSGRSRTQIFRRVNQSAAFRWTHRTTLCNIASLWDCFLCMIFQAKQLLVNLCNGAPTAEPMMAVALEPGFCESFDQSPLLLDSSNQAAHAVIERCRLVKTRLFLKVLQAEHLP